MNIDSFVSDPGFTFTEKVHPICLPVESNDDPERWNEKNVEVLGCVKIFNKYQ